MSSLSSWAIGVITGAVASSAWLGRRQRRPPHGTWSVPSQSQRIHVSDVTEQRRVERELRAREHLLEEMGELAKVGGWNFDVRTGEATWTGVIAQIHGVPAETTPNPRVLFDLYSRSARSQAEAAFAAAITRGETFDLTLDLVTLDGEHKWVRTIGRPIVEGGVVTRVCGALQDVTAQKLAEAAMQDRLSLQERLATLAATSPGVMYSLRRDTDGRISFPFATRQLDDLFGVAADTLKEDATPALARVHPDDLQRIRADIDEAARSLGTWSGEFRVEHPTRGTIWVEGRSATLPQPDGSVVCHGFFLDVTARKLLEEQLRQSQKMEAIGQLAGGVAHDFNNLLTVIVGNASLLTDRVTSPDALEHAHEIMRAGERAAGLTHQLLLFGRRQVLHLLPLDINEAIGTMARLLERLLGEQVSLDVSLTPGLPTVRADPGMLGQVLLNLAVNARDAMPRGGQLTVTTSLERQPPGPAERADAPADGWVCLTVRDTGTGMSDAVKARIFEPFFTTKPAGKGTGLGLATVYGIVRQHGGVISVASVEGAGTTFRIGLPAVSRSVEPTAAHVSDGSRASGAETVLVVEDEPAVRQLTAGVLEQIGYRVLTASTGSDALDAWARHRDTIALVLTDIVMPGELSGPEFARRLHAERPDVPVIFVSGYSPEASAAGLALEEGVNFLQKPYEVEELGRVVRDALDRRQRAR